MRPIVIFDLDGTLADTAHDIMASLNHVLISEGIEPVVYEDMTYLVGQGARVLIERAYAMREITLDVDHTLELLSRFRSHYMEEMPRQSTLYPGIPEALERFKSAGFALAVCTNKLESLARPLIEGLKVTSYFDAIAGGDTFSVRKPDGGHILSTIALTDADPKRAVMIGDSVNDIQAARNAGIASIAVPFGYSDVPVESLAPTHIINHFDELTIELVESLIRK